MPRVGELQATDVWAASARTLTAFAAADLFNVPIIDANYVTAAPASSATLDTFGSWVEVSADVGTGKRLLWIILHSVTGSAGPTRCQLQFGEGAAGSEAAVGILELGDPAASTAQLMIPVWLALSNNARLSVRVKDGQAQANSYRLGANIA